MRLFSIWYSSSAFIVIVIIISLAYHYHIIIKSLLSSNLQRDNNKICSTSQKPKVKLDNLRWFSQCRSPIPHFGGANLGGLWLPNSNSAEIFVQCTYPQVSSSCVYSFGSYHVDKQTNKQTPLKTSNVLRYATTLGKQTINPLKGRGVNWLHLAMQV